MTTAKEGNQDTNECNTRQRRAHQRLSSGMLQIEVGRFYVPDIHQTGLNKGQMGTPFQKPLQDVTMELVRERDLVKTLPAA